MLDYTNAALSTAPTTRKPVLTNLKYTCAKNGDAHTTTRVYHTSNVTMLIGLYNMPLYGLFVTITISLPN